MLSRVAENLYWIARYVERAENLTRLLDDAYHLELDAGLLGDDAAHRPLGGVSLAMGSDPAAFPANRSGREAMIAAIALDPLEPHSVRTMIATARENARATQETLTVESWSRLNQLHLYLGSQKAKDRLASSPFRFFERVKRECLQFVALIDSTLPRTEAYYFLRLGRFLERVDMTSRMIGVYCEADVHGPAPAELLTPGGLAAWVSLLRSCSAYEAYLKTEQDRIDPFSAVRYLVLEENFPRAIRYGVARGLESVRALIGLCGEHGSPAERQLGRLDSELRNTDIHDVFTRGVTAFLADVQQSATRVGRELELAYFLN